MKAPIWSITPSRALSRYACTGLQSSFAIGGIRALDAAVEAAYGVDFGGDEEKIVAHLFKLYAEKTAGE